MATDFNDYINGLTAQFTAGGVEVSAKPLPYGRQLVLTQGAAKATLSVYNGKKGIKLVWVGKDAAFLAAMQALADAGTDSGNYCLLKDFPEFNGVWAGSDESGKGDFFGPLVVAAAACDEKSAVRLFNLGVRDCKALSDKEVNELKNAICESALSYSVLALTPKMYNYRYAQLKSAGQNLNHLLSSGHAAALCAALAKCHGCNYALVDRFAAHNDIAARVHAKFPSVNVVQLPKAEADIAVAAASVLARAEFLRIMAELEKTAGCTLPKGGGAAATEAARNLAARLGREALGDYVKLHFANYKKI